MAKDKVVIAVITTVIFSAILLGIFMAYKIYREPLYVEDIEQMISVLKRDFDGNESFRMLRLSLFNDLSRSCKMKNRNTNEVRKFTKEEMNEMYQAIGGKEAVIEYLKSIEDVEERRKELENACYKLKVITNNELIELW